MSANVQHLRAGTVGIATARRGPARANPVIAILRRLLDGVVRARRRRIAIDDLSRLDDRQLEDIGLRREQIPELVYCETRRQEPVGLGIIYCGEWESVHVSDPPR